MTRTEMDREDERLDALFAIARRASPRPSETLLKRVLADADAEMPPGETVPAMRSEPGARGLARGLAALGGWRGLGGLATATVAGLWVGYAGLSDDPSSFGGGLVDGLIGASEGARQVELLPGTEAVAFLDGWEG